MKQQSLSFKLNISILILLLLILSAAVYTIIMINKTQTFAQETGQEWLPSVLSVSQMNEGIGKYARRILGLLTTSLINTGEEEIKTKEEDIKTLDKYAKIIDEYLANHQKFADSEKEKDLLNEIKEKWKLYDASSREAIEINKKGEKAEAIRSILSKGRKAASDLEAAVKNLGDYNYKGGVDSTAKGANLTAITNITMATIIGTSILIAVFIFKIISTTTVALTHAIKNLKHQSEASNDIANKLKDGSDILSNTVSEQAAAVHETTAAINEISSMVNRTAENAKESNNVAQKASDKAQTGQETMKNLVEAMESIQEANDQLQNIAEIIKQINTKTTVINDIVSKTELLSLNASIESARAGEYGKGFAVVAEEVGNLAKISGKSAEEIQELITKSEEQVIVILGLTKERVEQVKKVTHEAQGSFHQIADDISNMANVIQQISDATREQEIGVRQIAEAMGNIDKATQKSQSAVVSAADSSTQLLDESQKLEHTAQGIELLVKGTS